MGILRIFLAIIVIGSHTSAGISFGTIGAINAVESFFMISGFYCSMILSSKYSSCSSFIFSRVLRIYSTYWLILFVYICILGLERLQDENLFTQLFIILSNFTLIGADLGLWLDRGINNTLIFVSSYQNAQNSLHSSLYIPPAWSLSLELLFFILIPFINTQKKNYYRYYHFYICKDYHV